MYAIATPSGARGQRDQHALGEQLPHDAAAAGAERRADGDFPLTHRRAREQQVGDVGAGNQQHQADRAHHRDDDQPDLGWAPIVAQRPRRRAPALIVALLVGQLLADRAMSRRASSNDTPGFMRANAARFRVGARAGVLDRGLRNPQLRALAETGNFGGITPMTVWGFAVDRDACGRPPRDPRRSGAARRRGSGARRAGRPGCLLRGGSGGRGSAGRRASGTCSSVTVAPLNRSGSSLSESVRLRPVTAAISAKRARPRLQSCRSQIRHAAALDPVGLMGGVERDQRVGIAKRQRTDGDRVDDAEDRAVHADPERQAGDGQRREARVPHERSDGVAQVLE